MNTGSLDQKLHKLGFGGLATHAAVSGGDISQAYRVETKSGPTCFLKYLASAPADMFETEAHGLQAIAETHSLNVPKVLWFDQHHLLLEFIAATTEPATYWEQLGAGLASMHKQPQHCFGFSVDNFCGKTPQPNPLTADGHQFFADFRLNYQGHLAAEAGLLSTEAMLLLERICARLDQLIPVQPPCLVHGDLWSGNHMIGANGKPYLIDPACYWGWAEADLAMTQLFGGFPQTFYRAYHTVVNPEPGWRERFDLYNLYHILNHLNLFGSSYYSRALEVIRKYA